MIGQHVTNHVCDILIDQNVTNHVCDIVIEYAKWYRETFLTIAYVQY